MMPDSEKVIEGLEFTLVESGWDADAAYDQELMIQAVTGAITLLEAQKPRTPHYTILRYIVAGNEVSVEHPECPKCYENGLVLWDAEIERGAAYCKRCGQAVRWE